MNLFTTIKDSIYNPSFYKSLVETPVKKSVGFYFKFIAIISFIAALFVIPALLMLARPATYQTVLNAYPRELEVAIKDGKATTNVQEPYFIKNTTGEGPENILVIDTKTDFSLSQFDEYKTIAVLKKDNLAVQGEKGQEVRIMRLSTVGNITINYALVESWLNKFQSLAKYILPLIFVLMIVMFYIINTFRLIYVFIAALIVWVIARILKKNVGYAKAYQISLHAIVLPLLLQIVAMLFGRTLPPFVFSFILFLIAAINISQWPQITDTPAPSAPVVNS